MSKADADRLAQAIEHTFISPNELDRNFEPAGVVDGLFAIARAVHRLADAVEAAGARSNGRTAEGGQVPGATGERTARGTGYVNAAQTDS